jgi:hypothetical protein
MQQKKTNILFAFNDGNVLGNKQVRPLNLSEDCEKMAYFQAEGHDPVHILKLIRNLRPLGVQKIRSWLCSFLFMHMIIIFISN